MSAAPNNWRFLEAHNHDADHNIGRPLTIVDEDNDTVAEVYSSDDATVAITRAEAVAHAHMIAAAPDMLAALEDIAAVLDTVLCFAEFRPDVRMTASDIESRKQKLSRAFAAIQRAEGRS